MMFSAVWHRILRHWPQRWLALILVTALISCAQIPQLSSKAGPVDPKLEAEVLRIIREHPEVILESVQKYQQQQQQKQQQQQQSILQQLKAQPAASIGTSPTMGAKSQKIVLIEFSDFQCPFCARAHGTVKEFMAKHGDRVTLVYKHLPLVRIHDEALPAAKASWAAQQQGKFWEFHDAMFTHQDQLGDGFYVETAKTLKLDLARFNRDRTSQAADQAIAQDIQMAEKLGITGTPFFTLNGEPISGAVPLEQFEQALSKAAQP